LVQEVIATRQSREEPHLEIRRKFFDKFFQRISCGNTDFPGKGAHDTTSDIKKTGSNPQSPNNTKKLTINREKKIGQALPSKKGGFSYREQGSTRNIVHCHKVKKQHKGYLQHQ
jgi:hypothetical protein